jgi:hypothetical protein
MLDRASNDLFGGLLFDLVFAEGPFAEGTRAKRKLPNVTLLVHWRQSGYARKAFRIARRNLVRSSAAVLLLARIYAQDQARPARAERLIEEIAARPFTPAPFVEFARRSLEEWKLDPQSKSKGGFGIAFFTRSVSDKVRLEPFINPPGLELDNPILEASAGSAVSLGPIRALLAQDCLGTALAQLGEYVQQNPHDFEARLLLAEVWINRCGDLKKAQEIVRQIVLDSRFSPAQKETAELSVRCWKAEKAPRRAYPETLVLHLNTHLVPLAIVDLVFDQVRD